MKTILRNLAIYGLILFLLDLFIPGVTISGGLWTYVIGAVTLTIFFVILKPILSIISFPVNMVTLGVFNIVINALLLYLLTIFITNISITAFTYARTSLFGIIFPMTTFNTFFAYLYAAFVLTVINSFIRWLIN